jgi:Mn2+/Fe2+ NRAMP family transporter
LDDPHNEEIEREAPLEKDLYVQSQSRKKLHWLRSLGPGVITGASDDDPSGIATYSQAGAQFGFGMLWMALFQYPLMTVIQEMSARIGLITGSGLNTVIKSKYSNKIVLPLTKSSVLRCATIY